MAASEIHNPQVCAAAANWNGSRYEQLAENYAHTWSRLALLPTTLDTAHAKIGAFALNTFVLVDENCPGKVMAQVHTAPETIHQHGRRGMREFIEKNYLYSLVEAAGSGWPPIDVNTLICFSVNSPENGTPFFDEEGHHVPRSIYTIQHLPIGPTVRKIAYSFTWNPSPQLILSHFYSKDLGPLWLHLQYGGAMPFGIFRGSRPEHTEAKGSNVPTAYPINADEAGFFQEVASKWLKDGKINYEVIRHNGIEVLLFTDLADRIF